MVPAAVFLGYNKNDSGIVRNDQGRRVSDMNTDKQNKLTALDRYLSPLDVWAMAFGVMVGGGTFVMPGTTFLPVAGPAGTIIALLIGMLIMLVIAKNFV